ncbi:MAG: DegV family protein [Clostridia bacterium]|nr:DegV family protein [Clostridia bacterium]
MTYKIISDSSSDIQHLDGVDYASVPLKIITDEKEYVDDEALNVEEMVSDLLKYKGASKSSCPNAGEWQQAFGEAENVFCVTITSGLSGSCNAANMALSEHLEKYPEKKGYVVDTLSAGPENALIVEKLRDLIAEKLNFDEIVKKINLYKEKTHLLFTLESLRNLANNGRVSGAVAKITGILDIRVVGKASSEGTLEVLSKVRGCKKALAELVKQMLKNGYNGGKVRIHHCQNVESAKNLSQQILSLFPKASVVISETRALCSFYAEAGGLLVGYESL